MAEDFVSRDQHRADLAELRLELANTLASLDKRTELIAQDLGALRREMQQGFNDLRADMRELRGTTQRQLWVMVGVVAFAILTGVIKLVFFP